MLYTWIILIVAIAAETFATTMVRASEGFTRLLPSLGVVAGYAVSFYGLSQVVKVMNLGIAYAIWAGFGHLSCLHFSGFSSARSLIFPPLQGWA